MSRVSSLVLGTVAFGIAIAAMGCKVEVSTKQRYVESNVVQEDTTDWAGQPITIDIKGVGLAQNGGVTVIADPNVTKVKATARLLALAFEKPDADQSIVDAKGTYKITNTSSGVTVECGHGGTHGDSNSGESGCEFVEVRVPVGDATKPLSIKVLSGNGAQTLQLSSATIAKVETNANGAGADISADLPATKGGVISLVAETADDIAVKLPSDFAADEVILQAETIELGPFDDVKNGAGAGGRGTAGTGLSSLKLTSKEFAGSTGTITLR